VKQGKVLFLVFVMFACACCSPSASFLSETISPTTIARDTALPVTITHRSTVEAITLETSSTPFTPTVRLSIEEETVEPVTPAPDPLTVTIVYDNIAFDDRLKTAWGFSALVEYQGHNLLFDTGGDGPTLIENMLELGIDPGKIDSVVLSHPHGDHTGGLNAVLEYGSRPTVYLLPSFPVSFKSRVSNVTEVIEAAPGQMIAEDIFTTGQMKGDIPEQGMVIHTDQGLVIVTGCAHPGIVKIVEQAQDLFDEPVHLVLGGFHLASKNQAEIDAIISDFRRLDVKQVAPCHCTGGLAIASFALEYKEDFLQAGVGTIFRYDTVDQ
jgi:7,8-dihydropterin-6-yl-methyl-4-(beta-D-ribofuranosyl)aminobenzene 5'-phosphate synthase